MSPKIFERQNDAKIEMEGRATELLKVLDSEPFDRVSTDSVLSTQNAEMSKEKAREKHSEGVEGITMIKCWTRPEQDAQPGGSGGAYESSGGVEHPAQEPFQLEGQHQTKEEHSCHDQNRAQHFCYEAVSE